MLVESRQILLFQRGALSRELCRFGVVVAARGRVLHVNAAVVCGGMRAQQIAL
jgi:hypothetical protein